MEELTVSLSFYLLSFQLMDDFSLLCHCSNSNLANRHFRQRIRATHDAKINGYPLAFDLLSSMKHLLYLGSSSILPSAISLISHFLASRRANHVAAIPRACRQPFVVSADSHTHSWNCACTLIYSLEFSRALIHGSCLWGRGFFCIYYKS